MEAGNESMSHSKTSYKSVTTKEMLISKLYERMNKKFLKNRVRKNFARRSYKEKHKIFVRYIVLQ